MGGATTAEVGPNKETSYEISGGTFGFNISLDTNKNLGFSSPFNEGGVGLDQGNVSIGFGAGFGVGFPVSVSRSTMERVSEVQLNNLWIDYGFR